MANNENGGGGHNVGWFLGGLGAGLALGITIGILFAPRPGYETRRILRERLDDSAENLLDRLDAFVTAAKKKLEGIAQRLGMEKEGGEESA
ncbi:MAG: YtxH domain-containing protein [bacterium JZ-2024 1]